MSLASKYEILQKQRFWPNYGTGTLFSGVGQKNVTYNQPIPPPPLNIPKPRITNQFL